MSGNTQVLVVPAKIYSGGIFCQKRHVLSKFLSSLLDGAHQLKKFFGNECFIKEEGSRLWMNSTQKCSNCMKM